MRLEDFYEKKEEAYKKVNESMKAIDRSLFIAVGMLLVIIIINVIKK